MTRSTVAASRRDRGRCRQNKRAADHTAHADKAQRMTKKKKGFKGIKDPDSWKDRVREARRTGRIILNSGQQSGMNSRGIFKRISMMINVASMNWNLMDAIRFYSVNVMKWKGQGKPR